MANLKFYLDTRRVKADGTSALKLSVSHNSVVRYVPLGIYLKSEFWDSANQRVKPTHPRSRNYNSCIMRQMLDAEDVLLVFLGSGVSFTTVELTAAIAKKLNPDIAKSEPEPATDLLLPCFKAYMETKEGKTKRTFEHTLSRLGLFCEETEGVDALQIIRFDCVTRSWLMKFDAYLSKFSSPNTRGIHFRNLRTVFNFAIDEGLTTNYPFRKFKIPREKTMKRSLSVERLRELFAYDVEDCQQQYLDFFKLTFYLMGINSVDLLSLTPESVVDGRINFRRSKAGRLYSMRIEPEAAELLEKYKGEKFLLSAMDRYGNYENYSKRVNKALQHIGPMKRQGRGGKKIITAAFPGLTTYWARHSWATIAADLDIPDATISLALGHAAENSTTDIYIRRNLKKVDAANRMVLDWVLYGKTSAWPGGPV